MAEYDSRLISFNYFFFHHSGQTELLTLFLKVDCTDRIILLVRPSTDRILHMIVKIKCQELKHDLLLYIIMNVTLLVSKDPTKHSPLL